MQRVRRQPLVPCVTLVASLVAVTVTAPWPLMAGTLAPPVPPPVPLCALADLPGLSSQYSRARRDTRTAPGAVPAGLDAAPAADFWRVARAVLGPIADDLAAARPDAPVGEPPRSEVPCDGAVRARDRAAWHLGLAGYTAREIADVLAGHLTRADLDDARARLMAGHGDQSVAAFLEARWREPAPVTRPAAPAAAPRARAARPVSGDLDATLTAYAREHRVPADLVRAVVAAESGGNPRAV